MAMAARPVLCQLNAGKLPVQIVEPSVLLPVQKVRESEPSAAQLPGTGRGAATATENSKILLQPRLCTLRSYGSDRVGMIRLRSGDGGVGDEEVSPFFATLSEYLESSKKSQEFEILSGRLAMILLVGTVTMESVTGNSLFNKMDVQGIEEAAGVCIGAITFAAIFAWFSSTRNRVDKIFAVKCNSFIDSLIDQIFDGLFYESEFSDWSDGL